MAHDVSMSGSIATGFIVTTIMLLCPLFYKLLQVSEIWQAVNTFSRTRRWDKVFRYSFWETIPMFLNYNHLKSDFILVRSLRSFTSDWLWNEVCQNTVFMKLDITIVIRGDWLWKEANINDKNNSAAVYVGSTLKVHNPLFSVGKLLRNKLMQRFYWSIQLKW